MTTARTFDAHAADRGIVGHMLHIADYPAQVWRHRFMMQNFLRRDLLSRVHGSFLGLGWLLLQPMFLFGVYYLVFGILLGQTRVAGQGPDPMFALQMFSGIIVFHSLQEATTQACSLIVDNGNLVKKVAFPSEVLLVHVGAVAMVIFAVGATVCVVAGVLLGVAKPGWLLAALPLVMAVQFVMTIGIGLILATLNIFIRDTVHVWRLMSMAWMFVSPVFWMPEQVAPKLPPWGMTVMMSFNPASPLLQANRLALGGVDKSLGEFWPQLGIAAAWAFGLLLIGYGLFMSRKHKFTDLI